MVLSKPSFNFIREHRTFGEALRGLQTESCTYVCGSERILKRAVQYPPPLFAYKRGSSSLAVKRLSINASVRRIENPI